MRVLIVILITLAVLRCFSQGTLPIIFNDANESMITGTWQTNGTLTKITNAAQCEGVRHYSFTYSASDWWAGIGLNMNNWATSPGVKYNFSSYSHIRITYKGMSGAQKLAIKLRNNYASNFTNELEVGGAVANCTTVEIPLASLVSGANFDLTSVTEINFSIVGVQVFSGTVIIDDIRLVNSTPPPPPVYKKGSNIAWQRHSTMLKGVNFSNWLEAYWLLPFNAYPETNKYNRTLVTNLKNQGFSSIRLPVTFERVADVSPGDTMPDNSIVWNLIDSTLAWANHLDMNVSICNHHGLDLTNANFQSQIPRIKKIWGQVMRKYKNTNPAKVFFELYNEPNAINNTNFRVVAQALIDTVRYHCPNHTLIIGGDGWNSASGLQNSLPFNDDNIIYTFHSYNPYFFTHQGMSWTSPPYFAPQAYPISGQASNLEPKNDIDNAAVWGDNYDVPVMLGEFGVSTSADATSRCNYADSIAVNTRKYSMPWYYWDAISLSDAFGFVGSNGTNVTPCFANSLRLASQNICPSTVTSIADSGPNTLREALICASEGSIITIQSGLGDILLKDRPVFINKNITLNHSGLNKARISSSTLNSLLFIAQGKTLTLQNIELLSQNDEPFINSGTLILHNSIVKTTSGIPVQNRGQIIISGTTRFE